MYSWTELAKKLMFMSTFTAPFYIIFPSNAGLYEILIIFSAICLVLSGSSWVFPSRAIMISLIMVLIGYSISILNAVNLLEALKFTIQFTFIILVQLPVILSLTENEVDFRKHAYSLFLALSAIVIYFLVSVSFFGSGTSNYTSLMYGNYNNFASLLLILIIPSVYLFYWSQHDLNRYQVIVGTIIFSVGIIALFSTQSRRVYPALLVVVLITFSTSFLRKIKLRHIVLRGTFAVMSITLFVIGLFQGLFPETYFGRIEATITGDHSGGGIDERIETFEQGFVVVSDQFPWGTGYNNYGHYASISEPHNLFLEPFAEGGILAGIGILSFFSLIVVNSGKNLILCDDLDPVAASFFLATIGFIIAYLVGTLIIFRIFWLIPILSITFYHNS